MTHKEMLEEIEAFRAKGHKIGITGSGTEWDCEFDGMKCRGINPVEAYTFAKPANMELKKPKTAKRARK